MAIARFKIVGVWSFGLLDYGSTMLHCKIGSLPFLGLRQGGGCGGAIKFCHLATLTPSRRRRFDRERERGSSRSSFSSLHRSPPPLSISARQRPRASEREREGNESAMWSERKTNDANESSCEQLHRAVEEAPRTARCPARSQS